MHCTFLFLLSRAFPFVAILCLSSLSFSFSLLIMAPKKSILSKTSICRGSSSSSSSSSSSFPSDSVRFCDEKAWDDFFANFSDRAIHLERQVILSDFPDTPLPGAFSSRGWASLCEKPLRCPDVFIQEFYFNMHAINTSVPRFITVFRGTRIIVTAKLISEVLHVPRVDRLDYPSHLWFSSISRDELASLFCEKAMLWEGNLNFSTIEFAKGRRILNMVMTFVLTLHSLIITLSPSFVLISFFPSWRVFL